MFVEQFCDRLERDLMPDVQIVEISTPWDKDATHHRIPSILVLVQGDRVFPRYSDMMCFLDPKMKVERLTITSFDLHLNIDYYIKEWYYNKHRVELFTSIRDRAIEQRDKEKTRHDRLEHIKPPKELPLDFAKILLKAKDDFYMSMLFGECGLEIARLCKKERAKLGDLSIIGTNDSVYPHKGKLSNLKIFQQLERRVNWTQSQIWLYK